MQNIRPLLCLLSLFLFTGCEKTISFPLKEEAAKLVVEGSIEIDQAPRVVLTRSTGYFDKISPDILLNSFVHDAVVTVSDGTRTQQLKEYKVPITPTISLYYYSSDTAQGAAAWKGKENQTYRLTIVSEGKTYEANTTIPAVTKKIDSFYWKRQPGTDTSKVSIVIKATDPKGYGDYVRYYTRINREPVYLTPFNSVFDDLFVDGTTYEVQIEPGFDKNADTSRRENFFRGDTVNFKLSNIDKATYDFWRTWEFAYGAVGNPFSTPVTVIGNVSNGALGYFGGYASQYRTLVIPK